MTCEVKRLNARHLLMVRLALQGWRYGKIAEKVGVARDTVSRVLNSPPAKAELARMQAEAQALTVNIPFWMWLYRKLETFATTAGAFRFARDLRDERTGLCSH